MAAFTALTIAGLALGGVQAFQSFRAGRAAKASGEAQQEAAESQAELAEFNAEVADLQAKDALDRGAEAENRFRTAVRGIIGSQRAAIAAANIDVGFGSALDVQEDAARLGEHDALQIRTNAAREAWGFKVESEDLRRRAQIAREEGVFLAAAGRERQTQANLSAASTLLGTGISELQRRYGTT